VKYTPARRLKQKTRDESARPCAGCGRFVPRGETCCARGARRACTALRREDAPPLHMDPTRPARLRLYAEMAEAGIELFAA
jgi:hypothetical protein